MITYWYSIVIRHTRYGMFGGAKICNFTSEKNYLAAYNAHACALLLDKKIAARSDDIWSCDIVQMELRVGNKKGNVALISKDRALSRDSADLNTKDDEKSRTDPYYSNKDTLDNPLSFLTRRTPICSGFSRALLTHSNARNILK